MKNYLIALSVLVAFVSCNGNQAENESNTEKNETEVPEETADNNNENASADIISDENLETFSELGTEITEQVLDAYLKIKDALVNTNGEEAKKIAASIHKDLESGEGEAISIIREDIEHIANTESVEHQREHFKTLSTHVYAIVKSNSANDMTLYKQYCPMAFDNTGAYWLSSSEEIRNPYFGNKMLKCGKVQETLTN